MNESICTNEFGTKYWRLNGKLHRIDGPAIELANGDKEWHLNGKRHRTDGPAVEWIGVAKHWYLNGKRLTVEEFNERITQTNKKIKSHF